MVHIGLNKAGSSTIQAWLTENATSLRACGVESSSLSNSPDSLPQIFGIPCLAMHLSGLPIPNAQIKKRFDMETPDRLAARLHEFGSRFDASLQSAPDSTHVVSSEYLAAWLKPAGSIATLHEWLSDRFRDVEYVLYLRNQIDWVTSSYNQSVKMGGTMSLDDYIEKRGTLDLHTLVRRWTNAVGRDRLALRLLEADALVGGDLLEDFAAILGVSAQDLSPVQRMNQSLSAEQIRRFLEINRTFAAEPDGLRSKQRRKLRMAALSETGGEKLRLSAEQIEKIQRWNADSNEALRAAFFPDRAQLFPKMARGCA